MLTEMFYLHYKKEKDYKLCQAGEYGGEMDLCNAIISIFICKIKYFFKCSVYICGIISCTMHTSIFIYLL